MSKKKKEGDKIVNRFLKTGELPELPIIKLKPEDVISKKDGKITISILDFLDISSKVENNPWEKLSYEQSMLIASNIDGFMDMHSKIILMDAIYHPEKYIADFKSKKAQKVIFKKRDTKAIYAVTRIANIYLDVISNQDKY